MNSGWKRPENEPAVKVLCPFCRSSKYTHAKGGAQVVSTLKDYRLWYCVTCGKHLLSETE